MRAGLPLPKRDKRRGVTLTGVIVLQVLCAAFFVSDIVSDFGEGNFGDTNFKVEAVATLVLLVGVIFLKVKLRGAMSRLEKLERGLRAARWRRSSTPSLMNGS